VHEQSSARLSGAITRVAYGPNHIATGKATYVNLNSYTSGPSKMALGSEVPVDGRTNKDGSEILTDDSQLGVIFRIYLEPATSIGAAFAEVVYDKLIKFSPVVGR